MHLTSTAISLNVSDPDASARFLADHIGHRVVMKADGFVSTEHPDGGPNIIFLRTGLETFKPANRAGDAGEGVLLVFVVEEIDEAFASMRAAGATVVTAPETEPWGERYCQFEDPNGIVVQLVQWVS